MKGFRRPDEDEVQRINKLQRDFFDTLTDVFEPPLPEGVPERLDRIVASAGIGEGDRVLDIGSGTGILVPRIKKYSPGEIIACDLSFAMLERLKENHPYVRTVQADARDLDLPDAFVDVVIINASYPNIVDKHGTFTNMARIIKPGGRMVISHPMGRAFIEKLRDEAPFPLDAFPERPHADGLFSSYGFEVSQYTDESRLYILVTVKI
jgi:ubiquinone/menaquinone biosynthesis C-methylase UbiE